MINEETKKYNILNNPKLLINDVNEITANEINLYKRDRNYKLKNINEIDIKLPPRRLTISRLYYKLRKFIVDSGAEKSITTLGNSKILLKSL